MNIKRRNDIQYNYTLHHAIEHNVLNCDIRHKTQYRQLALALNVIMLNVIMLSVYMLNVIMLNVIMLSVIMLIAVMLNEY
jgi:hypothetical protein